MKKILIIALILQSLIVKSQSDLEVTYLGNEGFLIVSGQKKVLIDALFQSDYFTSPTDEMLNKIMLNKPPFNNVSIAFVTHAHSDHFSPDISLSFLQNQKESKLIAPEQAIDKMRELPGFNSVKSRIISVGSEFGEYEFLNQGQIKIETFCLKHSPYWKDGVNRHAKIKNAAYIIELDGTRLYHCGDATFKGNIATFHNYDFSEKPIDLMFLQRYDNSFETKHFIANTIKPDEIMAMHISNDDISHWRDRFTKHYPFGKVFDKQEQTYRFTNNINFHELSGEYFGLKKPGDTPVVFAPGIISTPNLEHSYPSFSPNGKEVTWSMVRRPKTNLPHVILHMNEENGKWSWPQIISFSGQYTDDKPMFALDGQFIIFTSKRPTTDNPDEVLERLPWYSLKTADGWSEPILIREISDDKNHETFEMYGNTPIVKVDNQLFKLNDIDIEALKNKGSLNWTFNLSLDGSQAVFSSNRMKENDYGDIYYSVNVNDSWSEPISLNVANSAAQERFPGFSFDGEIFFFTRWTKENDQEIFWMKTPSELKKAAD